MSLDTWKKEFYPIEALSFAKVDRTDEELIAHCQRKWEGALDKNLKKHGVDRQGYRLFGTEMDCLYFGAETCALCSVHFNDVLNCPSCPLAQAGDCCLLPRSSYRKGDVRGMVNSLRAVLSFVQRPRGGKPNETRQ